jgi:hypothetical protein
MINHARLKTPNTSKDTPNTRQTRIKTRQTQQNH